MSQEGSRDVKDNPAEVDRQAVHASPRQECYMKEALKMVFNARNYSFTLQRAKHS